MAKPARQPPSHTNPFTQSAITQNQKHEAGPESECFSCRKYVHNKHTTGTAVEPVIRQDRLIVSNYGLGSNPTLEFLALGVTLGQSLKLLGSQSNQALWLGESRNPADSQLLP